MDVAVDQGGSGAEFKIKVSDLWYAVGEVEILKGVNAGVPAHLS